MVLAKKCSSFFFYKINIMQVVLQDDVKNVGMRGDIANVANGYARNFLIPNGLALYATPAAMFEAEVLQAARQAKREQIAKDAAKYAKTLDGLTLTFTRKVSSGSKLFAGISEMDVVEAVATEAKIELEKSQVSFADGHPKTLGEHAAKVHVYGDHYAEVKIVIEAA